jgi:RNA polymerase sigma factor (sigma-70 family)
VSTVNESGPASARASQAERAVRLDTLVNEARQGSQDALGEIVTEFSPLLWHVARAAGLSSGDAQDVVQTVWLRLLEHLAAIRTPATLPGWLVVTTRREAWRVSAAERRQVPVDQQSFTDLADPEPGSEEQVILDDQSRALWTAIRQLTPRCQELLRIIAFAARPDYAAVASRLGMQVGSVGPTRGRCLAKLRAQLAAGLEGQAL